jgi:branched-chain amino acid aminotransferase
LSDRGVLHGDAVFEITRVHRGRAVLLDWHRERLDAGLAAFRFGDASRIWTDVDAVLAEAGARDGVLRLVVTRGEGDLRAPLASLPPRTIVVFREVPLVEPSPMSLMIVDAPRVTASMPSAVAKYARYLPYLLAADDARARGFDEALLLDASGNIAEAATANVFAVVDGVVVTAPLGSGILAGVTRRWIVERGPSLDVKVVERALSRAELARASEVFLTSSVRGLPPVRAVDDVQYPDARPIRDRLAAAFAMA